MGPAQHHLTTSEQQRHLAVRNGQNAGLHVNLRHQPAEPTSTTSGAAPSQVQPKSCPGACRALPALPLETGKHHLVL
jgi:hypothetical protein